MEKIAFIGLGNIAHVHINFLKKIGKSPAVICDKSETRTNDFGNKYKILKRYTVYEELLEQERPDVVHILTPPNTHYKIIIPALEAGASVFCEKPLCLNLIEAEDIFRTAKRKKLKVCVDHTRIYSPFVIKARECLSEGRLGKINELRYDYDDPGPLGQNRPIWAKEMRGGIFEDLLPHPISVLLSIEPDLKIREVYSKKNTKGNNEALTIFLSSKNLEALIRMSINVKPLRNILSIYCERGYIKVDLRNFYTLVVDEKTLPNAISRIVNTYSAVWQMGIGLLQSILRIFAGRLHPYSGLEGILRAFYNSFYDKNREPFTEDYMKKVVSYTENIVTLAEKGDCCEGAFKKKQKIYNKSEQKVAEYFVTGATGFIGGALVKQLIKEFKNVRALYRPGSNADQIPEKAELVVGDMRNVQSLANALDGVKTVYHCAAAMAGDWADFYENTVLGTANLLKAIDTSQVEKLIYISSLSVINYKKLSNKSKLSEISPLENFPERRGFYTRSKCAAEKLVIQFAEKNKNVKVVIVRPGLVYGRESNKILSNIGILLSKYLFVFGLGKRSLGLNYINNLTDALINMDKYNIESGRVYHVVDTEQPNVKEIISKIKKISDEKIIPIYVPIFCWRFVLSLADLFSYAKTGIKGTLSYRFCSNSKNIGYKSDRIKKELNWKSMISFEAAINDIYC